MKTSLVITTISPPTRALQEFAAKSHSHGIDFVVVGDCASPPTSTWTVVTITPSGASSKAIFSTHPPRLYDITRARTSVI